MENVAAKGFTLLELTIAIALLAVVSAAAWVGMGQSYRRDIQRTASILASDIRHAQQMAIQKGTNTSVVFFGDSYIMFYYPRGMGSQALGDLVPLLNAEFAVAPQMIRFTPRGTTSTPTTIFLRNSRYAITLTLTLGAGRVLVQDPLPITGLADF